MDAMHDNDATAVDVARGHTFTQSLVEGFEEAIQRQGRKAYETWGVALFHSISDERAHEQLATFGLKPRDGLDFYNQGCHLAAKEKFAEAAAAFAKALEQDPKLNEAQFNLALALEKAGEKNKAAAAWKKALEVCSEEDKAAIREHLEAKA